MISISGKGGTGKTSVAALVLKVILDETRKNVLMIDADPATNLPDVLGVQINHTVGQVADKLKKEMESGRIPPSVTKESLLDAWVQESIVERERFDLLAMGRTEGEGCYCYVNNLLTRIVGSVSSNYDVVLMDMEAGLEHLSRRTDKDVDIMFVVTDGSQMGLNTAKRIRELADEMSLAFGGIYLVSNRVNSDACAYIEGKAKEMGVELIGMVPYDSLLAEYNAKGQSLLTIPRDTPAHVAVAEMLHRIGIV